tara:strand:- start:344 stop:487 length:144 start_codon:yes stop_codon:yes gene_type:complete
MQFLITCGGIALAVIMAHVATSWLLLFVPTPEELKSKEIIAKAKKQI